MLKNKRRKASVLLILLFIPMLLTGCFDYHDINKVTFPTSVIFDVNDLGQEVVYLDCIKPYRSTNDSSDKGRRIKIFYMTQATTKPPTFVVFVNDKQLFHFSYERYLVNQIRKEFGLTGTPIRMIVREKKGE